MEFIDAKTGNLIYIRPEDIAYIKSYNLNRTILVTESGKEYHVEGDLEYIGHKLKKYVRDKYGEI